MDRQANKRKHHHGKRRLTPVWLVLVAVFNNCASAAPVTYSYDALNRLTGVDHSNGQQSITYSYDAAGNRLTQTTAVAEQLPPLLTIISPTNGSMFTSPGITLSGTATDAGQGDSGIASVTVNALAASGDSATGADTANWSQAITLTPGTNSFTVIATDASPYANQTTQNLAVVYLPRMVDADSDDMADAWENAHGLDSGANDAGDEADSDGISNQDEYRAGTDPQNGASRPEGAGGVNYVLFRDHFDDAQYADRWTLDALDPFTDYTLVESGTQLQATVQRPASDCKALELRSFVGADGTNAVFHAKLRLEGYGATTVGLIQGADPQNNRLELRFSDTAPYLYLRSSNAGTMAESAAAAPTDYRNTDLDLRIAKAGSQYRVYVNNVFQGAITNAGLGDTGLRAVLGAESCASQTGYLDSRIDLVELLLDRDADGLPDTWEDRNADGIVNTGETSAFNPNMDADGVLDGFDNCALKANANQRDTNNDGYGNLCDPDLDNNGVVNDADQAIMKSRFYGRDPDADLNGDGVVNFADLAIMKSLYNRAPGPSGLRQP